MPANRSDLLTHDAGRYADELWWRERRPELVMGPGSWGWGERAYAATRQLERRGAMENVEVPVLIISTSADKLVRHPSAVRAANRPRTKGGGKWVGCWVGLLNLSPRGWLVEGERIDI